MDAAFAAIPQQRYSQFVRNKPLRILVTLLWVVWTGIIIPGHTRGVIPLVNTGTNQAQAASAPLLGGFCVSCCCCAQKLPGGKDAPDHSKPAHESSSNCAICNFAAKLSNGPGFVIILAGLGRAEQFVPGTPARPVCLEYFEVYNSRAPPLLSEV